MARLSDERMVDLLRDGVVAQDTNADEASWNGTRIAEAIVELGGGVGAGGGVAISAGAASQSTGTVIFSNSNGLAFGLNAGTLTGSYTVPAAAGTPAFSAGAASSTFQTLVFQDSNGISFSNNAGSLRASHNALTSQSNQAFSADASSAFQTLVFQDSNGISFSNNAGSLRLTHALQFTSATSAITANAMHSSSRPAFSADASSTFQTLTLQDSNGISFSNNAGAIRITHGLQFTSATSAITSAAMHSSSRPAFSAGAASSTFQTVVFQDSNGISFSNNAGSIRASHNALTSQSNQAFSADASSTFQTLTLQNSNGVSFSNNAGAVRITHDLMFSTSRPAFSAGAASSTFQTVVFQDSNGISFSNNAGSIRASHNALTSQSNQAFSADASSTFQTLTFQNSNLVSFSNNAGAIRVTHDLMASSSRPAFSADASSTFQTLSFQNSNNVSFSNNGGAIRLTHHLAGTTTGFTGANISGSMTHNSSGLALSLSVAAPGAAAENNWIHLLGANTAGNTTASGSTIGLSGGNNVTLSGTNGSVIVVSAAAGGGGATLSGSDPFQEVEYLAFAGGQASLWINQLNLPCAMQFDRFGLRITHSNATNSSGSATISVWVGVSTRNASTLSSVASTSFTSAITKSGTVGSHSLHGGIKILPIPWTTTLSPNNYWLGFVTRTTTGGANMTFGNIGVSQIASTMSGYFGSASNATAGMRQGEGVYSVTTAGMPTAISLTQINANSSAFHRKPIYLFMSNIF